MICAGCQHSEYCYHHGVCALGTALPPCRCDRAAPADFQRNTDQAGAAPVAEETAPVSQNFEVAA